jgi:hypothetical protein
LDILDIMRHNSKSNAAGYENDPLEKLAQSYGISTEQAEAIVATVVPALTDRIERNTLSRGGVADLVGELLKPSHNMALADPLSPGVANAGIGALDTIFGSKATSRNVAAQAAYASGVSQAIIQKLLPVIASMVIAALSKGSQGGLGEILKKLPDLTGGGRGGDPTPQTRTGFPTGEPDISSAPQSRPGRTGPSSGKWGQQDSPLGSNDGSFGGDGPLPIPGDRIPGINAPLDLPRNSQGSPINLPDIIRNGGQTVDGGSLGTLIRNVLGSVLGFQSKGFIGWALRLLVMRWGWGLLQRILSRVLTGR